MFPIAAGRVETETAGGRPSSWAATGRSGGVSGAPFDSLNLSDYVGDADDAVAENRARLARVIGAQSHRMTLMRSVHGREVAEACEPGVVAGVDGLVTQVPGLVIVAMGADCVPLALIGDDGRTIGVAHCGWRGLVVGIVDAVVDALADRGAGVARAVLGPAVCGSCYPVPRARADEVTEQCSPAVVAAARVRCPDGQPGIDVREGVRTRLIELGVDPRAIRPVGGCTVEDPGLFSYRRDGLTGRQGIGVGLVDAGRMGSS